MSDYLTAPLVGDALGLPIKKKALARALTGGQARTAWLNDRARKAEDTLGYYLGPAAKPIEALGAILEFTDAGDMTAAAEASRNLWNEPSLGNAASYAAAGAAMALPFYGAKMGEGVADLAGDIRKFASEEDGAIRLWHGSPHDFDRFSMDAIGTGEGAQAYGHGLYFAENEGVARAYRDQLTDMPSILRLKGGDRAAAIEQTRKNLANLRDRISEAQARADTPAGRQNLAGWQSQYEKSAAALAELESDRPFGRLYEVSVDANPEDFLDWDAPLSEQPKNVRRAYAQAAAGDDPLLRELLDGSPESLQMAGLFPNSKGSQAYNTIADPSRYNQVGIVAEARAGEKAARRLNEAGIPGIRYLDAGSRGAGDGSRNYVVFDDRLISIVNKFGIAGAAAMLGVSASDVQAAMQPMNDMPADEETLKDYLGL